MKGSCFLFFKAVFFWLVLVDLTSRKLPMQRSWKVEPDPQGTWKGRRMRHVEVSKKLRFPLMPRTSTDEVQNLNFEPLEDAPLRVLDAIFHVSFCMAIHSLHCATQVRPLPLPRQVRTPSVNGRIERPWTGQFE